MHLLQAGVNLIYIRDILGHVSIQTTEIYARADSEQKRKALENAYAEVGLTEPKVKSWERNSKLKEYLKRPGIIVIKREKAKELPVINRDGQLQ
jgi:Phage integrase family.